MLPPLWHCRYRSWPLTCTGIRYKDHVRGHSNLAEGDECPTLCWARAESRDGGLVVQDGFGKRAPGYHELTPGGFSSLSRAPYSEHNKSFKLSPSDGARASAVCCSDDGRCSAAIPPSAHRRSLTLRYDASECRGLHSRSAVNRSPGRAGSDEWLGR